MALIKLKSSASKIEMPFLSSGILVRTLIILPSGEIFTLVYEGRELNLSTKSSLTPRSANVLKLNKRNIDNIEFFICKVYLTLCD